jgi:hypothetical protein
VWKSKNLQAQYMSIVDMQVTCVNLNVGWP